jgi:hypothetical protein
MAPALSGAEDGIVWHQ